MNANDWIFQLLLLLPVSIVSAAAISSVFAPRVGAAEVPEGQMAPDLSNEAGTKVKKNNYYNERIVQSQWEKQRRWSKLYQQKKKKIELAQFAKLGLVSMGAVAQVAATQVPPEYKVTTSFVGGVCVGIGAYLKNNYVTSAQVKDMVMSFYVSQAIKSEVNKFRAKAGGYGKLGPHKAIQSLKDTCNSISNLAGFDKKFHMMQMDKKPVPLPMVTREAYIENRIDKIINKLYLKQARQMEIKGAICSRIEDVLLGVGTVAGLGATQTLPAPLDKVINGLLGWTGAFTTISTAFANHQAKTKYEEIANQYYEAAMDLRGLKEDWPEGALKAVMLVGTSTFINAKGSFYRLWKNMREIKPEIEI
jgi:hypothetical protein